MKNLVASSVVLALLAAAPARAEQTTANPNATTDGETTMVVQQVGAAFMVQAAMTGLSFLVADQAGGRNSDVGLLMLAMSPLATASTVCLIGSRSERYEARGKCWPTIGVTMASVPVTLTMVMAFGSFGTERQSWHGPAIAAVWLGLPPILATTSWHLFKRPKAPVVAPHAGRPIAFGTGASMRPGLPAKGQVMFQLASATF